jgi:hypothetical protein
VPLRGSKNQQNQPSTRRNQSSLCNEGAFVVVETDLKAAKPGNMAVCKGILGRLLPQMKSSSKPVFLNIHEDSTQFEIARAFLTATAAGLCLPTRHRGSEDD